MDQDFDFTLKIVSLRHMKSQSGLKALDVLNIAAFFASEDIQNEMFLPVISDRNSVNDAVEVLQSLSLVQKGSGPNSFRISEITSVRHRQFLLVMGLKTTALKEAILLLNKVNWLGDYQHSMTVFNHAKTNPKLLMHLGVIPGNIVTGMSESGKFEEAVQFGKECEEFLIKIFGKYDDAVLHLKNAVGAALMEMLKREEAIYLLTEVYHNTCVAHPLDIKPIKKCMYLLVKCFLTCRSPSTSDDDIKMREIFFPEDRENIDTATEANYELNKWTYYAQYVNEFGLPKTAIAILNDVIGHRRCTFGPDDKTILDVMLIKSCCFLSNLKFSEALDVLEHIYEERKKRFGVSHIETIRAKLDIGEVLKRQGNLEESMTLFKKEAEKLKKVKGEKYELFLECMNQIAKIYMSQRDFKKALQSSSDLYDKLIRINDVDPFLCFDSRRTMGVSLLELGQPVKALEIFQDLLEKFGNTVPKVFIESVESKVQDIQEMELFSAEKETLHSFSKEGNLDAVLSIIKTGVDAESKDITGKTALHYAFAFGRVEVAKALIKASAKSMRAKDCYGMTPLHYASAFGCVELVKALVNVKVKIIEAKDSTGMTPLHYASAFRKVEIVRLLIKARPKVINAKDSTGRTPMDYASAFGRYDVVKELIECGATVTENSNCQVSPKCPSETVLEGKVISFQNGTAFFTSGMLPIHYASAFGMAEAVSSQAKNRASKPETHLE